MVTAATLYGWVTPARDPPPPATGSLVRASRKSLLEMRSAIDVTLQRLDAIPPDDDEQAFELVQQWGVAVAVANMKMVRELNTAFIRLAD